MSKYIIVEIDDEALELMRKNGDETKELIQCKDCKKWQQEYMGNLCCEYVTETKANEYCGRAERKEE